MAAKPSADSITTLNIQSVCGQFSVNIANPESGGSLTARLYNMVQMLQSRLLIQNYVHTRLLQLACLSYEYISPFACILGAQVALIVVYIYSSISKN